MCDDCPSAGPTTPHARGDGHQAELCRECAAFRDALGRVVRRAWIVWALEQPDPKTSWLVPFDLLSEPDKEVDRRIGAAVVDYVYRVTGLARWPRKDRRATGAARPREEDRG